MNCEKCCASLHYGAKYCNGCGEKVPKGAYEEEYSDTIWAGLDRAKDAYDKLFLKKITDSIVFKIAVLLGILLWGVYSAYSVYANIRVLENPAYAVEYNKRLDEYYIRTAEEEIVLSLYIPKFTDKIYLTKYDEGTASVKKEIIPSECSESDLTVKKSDADFVTVETENRGKITDKIKLIVTQ